MIWLARLACVVLLAVLGISAPAHAVEKMCIQAFIGQSNNNGAGERHGPLVPLGYVHAYSATAGWAPNGGNDPLPQNGGYGSRWPEFASAFHAQTETAGIKQMLVQTSINGGYQTDVGRNISNPPTAESWDVNGTAVPTAFGLIDNAKALAEGVGYDARVCGIYMDLGESESNGIAWHPTIVTKAIYKAALQTMINRFFDRYGATVFIFRTGSPRPNTALSVSAASGYAQVRDAQEETVIEMPTKTFMAGRLGVQHATRGMLIDDIHYSQDANDESGRDGGQRVARSGRWNRW